MSTDKQAENEDALVDSEEDDTSDGDTGFSGYDITAAPNDFNIRTLNDFIGSGIVKIPGFQRNYVWDIKRASKLVESIIMGIPIPQIFLYEEKRNKFIVIDGQQRYMTLYYFIKKRFPLEEKRHELRAIFSREGGIPDRVINDNKYFVDFNLKLASGESGSKNSFNGLNYATLDDGDRTAFELRTIRNVIIKQNFPKDDDSVMFEVFNRLNSGGVNLKPQEIRNSLFYSDFFDMLYRVNLDKVWRKHTPTVSPDMNMKDVEILLRGFAMLMEGDGYKPSLAKFLNSFSKKAKKIDGDKILYLESLFKAFMGGIPENCERLFHNKNTGRFNISIYESIFVAACSDAFRDNNLSVSAIDIEKINRLKHDSEFMNASMSNTSSTANVRSRLQRAKEMLG
ncbi:MAG: protein of unknown function DUF262 [Magnetococcales bacterium]|nr:protein of unknown function DUF262 [Magnetococcales bacterium]